MLRSTGVNVVYGWYAQGHKPKTPYIVINYLENDPFYADDRIYLDRSRWQVDLITRERNETLEEKLEKALVSRGLLFSKTQTADSADETFVMHYRFESL